MGKAYKARTAEGGILCSVSRESILCIHIYLSKTNKTLLFSKPIQNHNYKS